MKRFLLFLLIPVLVYSCKKDNSIVDDKNKINLGTQEGHAVDSFYVKQLMKDTTYSIRKVLQTSDEGYVLCGGIEYKPFEVHDVLIKYDRNGNLQWRKIFKERITYKGFPDMVEYEPNKFVAYGVVGQENGVNVPSRIVKFDINGNCSIKKIDGSPNSNFILKASGAFMIAGSYNENAFHLIDKQGNTLWVKSEQNAESISIDVAEDGTFLAPQEGTKVVKYSKDASVLLTLPFPAMRAKSINDGYLTIEKETEYDHFTTMTHFKKYDKSGKELWRVTQPNSDNISMLEEGMLNIFALTPDNYVFTSTTQDNILIIYVIDNAGKVTKTIRFPMHETNRAMSIAKTSDNGLIVVKSKSYPHYSPDPNILELTKISNLLK